MKRDEDLMRDQQACYYLTFSTVDWVDLFIRPVYKQIIVESLNHFVATRGLRIYAWCLMSNHLHLIAESRGKLGITALGEEFKTFTMKLLLENISIEPEQRKRWMLRQFERFSFKRNRLLKYMVWQPSVNPVFMNLYNKEAFIEQLEYIHQNPVRDRIVTAEEDYCYSSARDYAGIDGLVKIVLFFDVHTRISSFSHLEGNYFNKYVRN